ncbi:MAG: tRNA threonylcarbamoyladenosine dehydratase [Ignavibacteria bacterium]|nr:MAG: tRNA threonylcarbamoyladenosine dehydratase [Ignavibacteria bacterium]
MKIPPWLERTELLLGAEDVETLQRSHVLVIGLGGVGAYAAEQICRGGVGEMTIVDGDAVHESNRNRQLPALVSTQGRAKAEVLSERLRDINPNIKLHVLQEYLRDERLDEILKPSYDFVVDAIDTLSPKVFLLAAAVTNGQRVVTSLGAGGKVDPMQVRIDDISKTHHCRLGKILRKRLHRLGIRKGITAVYSPEVVGEHAMRPVEDEPNKKTVVGTISYMPPVFGCCCASVVLRGIIGK